MGFNKPNTIKEVIHQCQSRFISVNIGLLNTVNPLMSAPNFQVFHRDAHSREGGALIKFLIIAPDHMQQKGHHIVRKSV